VTVRILLVTHGYPPVGVAGVERLSEQTARSLTALGNEVTVLTRRVTPAPPNPKIEHGVRDGIQILTITGGGSNRERFPRLLSTLDRIFERSLLDVDPDVLLVSHLIEHSPGYVSIARRWGVPVVMELHDFFAVCERAHLERRSGELCEGPDGGAACAVHCFAHQQHPRERWSLRTHLFRDALEHAHALICPSEFVADYFRRSFPGQALPLRVIGNGVEEALGCIQPSDSQDRPLSLACVGVVTPHKGPHVALEALAMSGLKRAELTLFGPVTRPYFRDLIERAKEIEGLQFRAYGAFEPTELPVLLSRLDAVIVPSLVWETYSIAAREALACGVPVIASNSGALPEAIRDGENGLLFKPGSTSELAAILRELDRDRERLRSLRAGIRATDWISVQARTGQLVQVLHRVVADSDRTPKPASERELVALLSQSVEEP
jgi:glycosyltransferase involved in cell wall biosynthesis